VNEQVIGRFDSEKNCSSADAKGFSAVDGFMLVGGDTKGSRKRCSTSRNAGTSGYVSSL